MPTASGGLSPLTAANTAVRGADIQYAFAQILYHMAMHMLKGVNKQIIEVTDTGNQYISKAILFVAPEKQGYDGEFLIHQAKRYLQQTKQGKELKPAKKRQWKRLAWSLLQLGAGAAAGTVIAMLCMR